MKKLNAYETVKLICGKIKPLGDSSIDPERQENLKETIKLASALIDDIISVSDYQFNQAHSEREAGKIAREFMDNLREKLE